jgi:hypothetical protein
MPITRAQRLHGHAFMGQATTTCRQPTRHQPGQRQGNNRATTGQQPGQRQGNNRGNARATTGATPGQRRGNNRGNQTLTHRHPRAMDGGSSTRHEHPNQATGHPHFMPIRPLLLWGATSQFTVHFMCPSGYCCLYGEYLTERVSSTSPKHA